MLTDIFIVRHGQPVHNPGIPYHTEPGPDLSEKGRDEARQAAVFLLEKTIEHLFVSPFARTTQTAEQMLEILPIEATFTQLIREHPPGENATNVRERMREFLASIDDSPLARVALISHGSPIRELLHELTNNRIDLSGHNYYGGNPAPTCGIWHARREGESWHCELVFKPT